jgi:hypothetical protein
MNIIDKIKLYFKIKSCYEEVRSMEVKSGYKTTEFWLVVVSNIGNVVTACAGLIPPSTAVIVSAVLNCIYTILRSAVKNPDITTIVDNSTTVAK